MHLRLVAAFAVALAGPASAMSLSSADFRDGATIPAAHIHPQCGGANISPALAWSGVPKGARSLVLTMIDVSVPPSDWSHWIVVDLPPAATALARGVARLPAPARAVAGNFGDAYYDGPCPPAGSGPHRYEFTVWAMPSATTTFVPNGKANEVLSTLSKTSLDHATIHGTVER